MRFLLLKKGNPAVRNGSAAFRPHLTMGLALLPYLTDTAFRQKKPGSIARIGPGFLCPS